MKKGNVREAALEVLLKIEKDQAYSNLLLNETIKKSNLSQKDRGLLTEIVYGTLQYKKRLDFYLSHFSNKPIEKLDTWVLVLLRMTLYQMYFLDRIPERAAVHEAVQIAKKRGHQGIASMVNGILRSTQRKGLPEPSSIQDEIERIAVETSHPSWLIQRWIAQFGVNQTKEMAMVNLQHPIHSARVNTHKTSVEDVLSALREEGIEAEASEKIDESIIIKKGSLASTDAFKKGMLSIQDEASMLVAYALQAQENERILDACAAPGGKSTHIAEKMNNTGEIISLDIHQHKINLIEEQKTRLSLTNINTKVIDARHAQQHFEVESFDRILVDAPCSGLGVIQRKPDIKWSKREEDVKRLSKIQLDILESVWPLLKKDGLLVYSTCTVDKEENEDLISSFVDKQADAEFDLSLNSRLPISFQTREGEKGCLQLFPGQKETDGFFISAIKKI